MVWKPRGRAGGSVSVGVVGSFSSGVIGSFSSGVFGSFSSGVVGSCVGISLGIDVVAAAVNVALAFGRPRFAAGAGRSDLIFLK